MIRAIFILCFITLLDIFARSEVESLTLTIKSIENDLITLYSRPKNIDLKSHIYDEILMINRSVREIAKQKSSKESKNILEYLLYNNQEIRDALDAGRISKDSLSDLIEICQSMKEGVRSFLEEKSVLSVNHLRKNDIETLRRHYLLKANKIEADIDEDEYKRVLKMFKNEAMSDIYSKNSFIKVLEKRDIYLPNMIYILSSKLKRSQKW